MLAARLALLLAVLAEMAEKVTIPYSALSPAQAVALAVAVLMAHLQTPAAQVVPVAVAAVVVQSQTPALLVILRAFRLAKETMVEMAQLLAQTMVPVVAAARLRLALMAQAQPVGTAATVLLRQYLDHL